jgi:hypothetical protein
MTGEGGKVLHQHYASAQSTSVPGGYPQNPAEICRPEPTAPLVNKTSYGIGNCSLSHGRKSGKMDKFVNL